MPSDRTELDRIRGDRGALVRALTDAGATLDGDKVRCPFHDDEHASGGVHEKGGVWWYTCQACTWNADARTGDVVSVTRRARGVDFGGALAVLGVAGNGGSRGGSGAPGCATAAGGTSGRADTPERPETVADAPADVAKYAGECAARLLADADKLAELWRTRAVDRATAERFGVGVMAGGWYWCFPIRDAGGRVVGVKHHRADPAGDGSKCFWRPRGTDSRRLWPVSLDAPGPVWLCPGELKALAVVAAGRSVVGITGGEGVELPDGLADVLAGRPVAVVADDDAQGRKWERATLAALRDAGLDVRAVDLGLDKAAGLKDVGDLILSRTLDGKEPAEIGAELDAAYERADPWAAFTLGGVWADAATWAPVYHVPTGLRALDDGLGGGVRVGGVHLIVGKSGRAKTTLTAQVALNAARAGVPVGFVSLEMTRRDVGHLLAANLADVPRKWLADGTLRGSGIERLHTAIAEFSALPLAVVDDGFWTGALTRSGLVRVVGDGCRRFGWRLVLLDYLGLLGNEPTDGSEYTADLENSAALKRLARVQDVALVAVAALRKYKRAEAEQGTTLDDVLGAGRLAYDAVNVLDVDCEQAECEAGTRPTGLVRLRPLKTRFSGLATPGRELQFRWYPGIGRICDREAEPSFYRGELRIDKAADGA